MSRDFQRELPIGLRSLCLCAATAILLLLPERINAAFLELNSPPPKGVARPPSEQKLDEGKLKELVRHMKEIKNEQALQRETQWHLEALDKEIGVFAKQNLEFMEKQAPEKQQVKMVLDEFQALTAMVSNELNLIDPQRRRRAIVEKGTTFNELMKDVFGKNNGYQPLADSLKKLDDTLDKSENRLA